MLRFFLFLKAGICSSEDERLSVCSGDWDDFYQDACKEI